MSHILPIGVDALLGGVVESTRLEFKASWSQKTTAHQVLKTICAFANDLYNLNGGYVVLGAAERDGVVARPVQGLPAEQVEDIQRQIRAVCNRIDPPYQPLISPEQVDGRHVLVICAPGSEVRPHHAPDGPKGPRTAWVRVGAETVKADREPYRTQLYQQTMRVPFDDRRASDATLDDLRESRVGAFLRDIKSDLVHEAEPRLTYDSMRLLYRVNGHQVPRNVALLFFADQPTRWFPGAYIDVVRFGADDGITLEERRFRGPLHEQLLDCLRYLESFTVRHLRKSPRDVQAEAFVSYPLMALREALVNAVYHRSYEPDVLEPTKVYLHADRVEVISYPGPAPGLSTDDFTGGRVRPIPARNRRIGELLKALRLAEERSTGVPKIYRSMRENGSPRPAFDFGDERSYFRVTLPAHPEYVTIEALSEAAYLETTGDRSGAIHRLRDALGSRPDSALLSVALIRLLGREGEVGEARSVAAGFSGERGAAARVALALADVLIDQDADAAEVGRLIDGIDPDALAARDALDAAILARRARRFDVAHRFFVRGGLLVDGDAKMLHEFAQTKGDLAEAIGRGKRASAAEKQARQRLLRESKAMLERVIQLDASRERHGWAWFDLAWVLRESGSPRSAVRDALERAIKCAPDEPRFTEALARYTSSRP